MLERDAGPVLDPLFFFLILLQDQLHSHRQGPWAMLMGLPSTHPPVWQNHHEQQWDPLCTPGCSCAGSQLCPMCWRLLCVFSALFMPPPHSGCWMKTSCSQIYFMWSIVSAVLFPSLQHPRDDPACSWALCCWNLTHPLLFFPSNTALRYMILIWLNQSNYVLSSFSYTFALSSVYDCNWSSCKIRVLLAQHLCWQTPSTYWDTLLSLFALCRKGFDRFIPNLQLQVK